MKCSFKKSIMLCLTLTSLSFPSCSNEEDPQESYSSLSQAATLVNASTKVLMVTDVDEPFYLLISKGLGYYLDAGPEYSEDDIKKIVGYNRSVILAKREDDIVRNSRYNSQPHLVFSTSDKPTGKLVEVTFTDSGTKQLFLKFEDTSTTFYAPGCLNVLTALGHDPCHPQSTMSMDQAFFKTIINTVDIDCFYGAPLKACACGDGIVQGAEICDEGKDNTDQWTLNKHCNTKCSGYNSYCGDSRVDGPNEDCDDGDTVDSGNGCSAQCKMNAVCGNGKIESLFEECDDGNTQSDDYCSSKCQKIGVCGDSVIQKKLEFCDDGKKNSDTWEMEMHCNGSCSALGLYCGDNKVSAPEKCDMGAQNSNAYSVAAHCNATCSGSAPYCGDLIKSGPEFCDDGTNNTNDWKEQSHCNAECTAQGPFCGDGKSTWPEVCDSGKANSNAWAELIHCNANCTTIAPYCGDGTTNQGFEVCDSGLENSDAYSANGHCNATCTGWAPHCGDGIPDQGEDCDDGPENGTYNHCTTACKSAKEYCGNKICEPIEISGPYGFCKEDCTGVACNDGNPCTDNDKYNGSGTCVGTPKNCNNGDFCKTGRCENGTCVYSTAPDGTQCDDGPNSYCEKGICVFHTDPPPYQPDCPAGFRKCADGKCRKICNDWINPN